MTIAHVFAPIVKSETTDDGARLVYGMITGPQRDLDEQGCDPAWLKTAVPDWFEIGNVREMHQAWAVGKALELEEGEDGWYTSAKIVDADAIAKIDAGVYTGFSIGIKSPKVVKDSRFPNGLITGGKIIETSVVDRPCNESAKILLAKMAGTKLVHVEEVVEVDAPDVGKDANTVDPDQSEDDAEEADEDSLVDQARAALVALLVGEAGEVADGTGGLGPVQILISLLSDLSWYESADAYDDVSSMAGAMKAALTPKAEEAPEVIKLSALADLVKAAQVEGADPDDIAAVAALKASLGLDELTGKVAAADEALAKVPTAEDLAKVANRVTTLEESPVPGGPVRTAAVVATEAAKSATLAEAAHLDKVAASITDPELRKAYEAKAQMLRDGSASPV